MKKRAFAWLSVCLAAALLLGGCGSAGDSEAASPGAATTESTYMGTEWDSGDTVNTSNIETPQALTETDDSQEAKRIYTANLSLETQSFDEAVSGLTALVEQSGGWFQESSLGEYGSGYRHGSYTVRVPAENFQVFLAQVGELCHVTWQSSSCEDVSEYYYDTAGRLKTQQTKLERLQALLAQAEAMEDIITIEDAISETELQIEALSGELRRYDSLVDYSTVYLDLEEVYRLSDTEAPASGFGERLAAAFGSGWKGFIRGGQGLLIALAYGWVWLVLLAAAAAVVLHCLRRRKKARMEEARRHVKKVEPIELGKPNDKSEGT